MRKTTGHRHAVENFRVFCGLFIRKGTGLIHSDSGRALPATNQTLYYLRTDKLLNAKA
jgi:hypothetical protein